MHRIATKNGALDAEKNLEIIAQTPGEVVFISAADTDLTCVAQTWSLLFQNRLRMTHAAPLQKPLVAEDYVERILSQTKLVILRLLGGKSYFPHLIEALLHLRTHPHRPQILILPGTDSWDSELFQYGDFDETLVRRFFE